MGSGKRVCKGEALVPAVEKQEIEASIETVHGRRTYMVNELEAWI